MYIICIVCTDRSHFGSSVQPLWLNLVSVCLLVGGWVDSDGRPQPFPEEGFVFDSFGVRTVDW